MIGDSRVAEGFSARVAAAAVNRRLHFWNFGMGGTAARVWYYALRDADPTRRRFAAIAIALGNYSDRDAFGDSPDRELDQKYLTMRLGLTDCLDYAMSIDSMAKRAHSLATCLFRGMALRTDVQAFAADPTARIAHVEDQNKNGLGYLSGYTGMTESLEGMSVDWHRRTIQFPEGVSETRQASVRRFVLPEPLPNEGANARYRQEWLGGILDLYRNSPTRLILLQLPRAPMVNPNAVEPRESARFVDRAARAPRVTVLPAETFTDLERPGLFADGLHLNRMGRPIFSERLAVKAEELLSGGRQ